MLRFRTASLLALIFLVSAGSLHSANPRSRPDLTVQVRPAVPLIEHRDGQQLLNFDLVVNNNGRSIWRLTEIEMNAYDVSGSLLTRKTVNSDGLAPGIEIVSKRLIRPGELIDVFNPFFSIAEALQIHRMEYVFRYLEEDNEQQGEANQHRLPMDFDAEVRVTVLPKAYDTRTALILPLQGRLLVWEGHDFYAHHRRIPLDSERVRGMGIHANANRYASDLVIVDDKARMYRDNPYDKKSYYVYGKPIFAPGSGNIVACANNIPDNEFRGRKIVYPTLPAGADDDLGNYVVIDHQNGEFSVFPHMLMGSVLVKPGDKVRQGQIIGRVGFSGDAIFPHVHYILVSGPNIRQSEALPAYFSQFERLLGSKKVQVSRGTLDSGDLVQSTGKYEQVANPH